jgi:hypothetical protein
MMEDWFYRPQKDATKTKKKKDGERKYRTDSRRLKLCKSCNKVWEWVYSSGSINHYEDFPTYGLRRVECKYCIKKKELANVE